MYAAGVVLWETLVGRRLFEGDNDVEVFGKVLDAEVAPPGSLVPHVPPELDAIVMRALARPAQDRFASARDMARAIERAVPPIAAADVGEWVERMAERALASRADVMARIEISSHTSSPVHARDTDPMARPPAVIDDAATQLSSGSVSVPRMQLRDVARGRPLALVAGVGVAAGVGVCGVALLVARGMGQASAPVPSASSAEVPQVAATTAPSAPAASSAPAVASAAPSSSTEPAPPVDSALPAIPRPAPRPSRPATGPKSLSGVLDSRK